MRLQNLRLAGTGGLPAVRTDQSLPATAIRSARPQRAFYDTHLIPELEHQMGGYRGMHGVPTSSAGLERSLIYAAAGDQARGRTIKGATNALKEFVLETTALNRTLDRLVARIYRPRSRAASDPGGPGSSGPVIRKRGDLGFSFGVAHRMPNVGIKYRIGTTQTRFEISGTGTVDFQFERLDAKRMHAAIGLRYDHRDRWYGMNYTVSF
jgi:hypothetical protein